ncbi:MAG TPA: type II 3-dehydroquinate dehydratase [Spirochaetota bacterium]|nr:type II 3-dehydroquinate dehydratase [Spirochaetota bacterium]HOM38767.1 type II 3-dehydroquinate dehydratase [Spirochaetota bacterium]HPQ49565.1 type II 3-dehydroquinate dehydratase [Spirochaetota bacterium]
MKIIIVNGPNLNMLGKREPDKYGKKSLNYIEKILLDKAKKFKVDLIFFQSNHEGEIIDFIQKEGAKADGMLINPGAYTHTSIAIRDAILSVNIPFVEVHITNIYKREKFRRRSYFKDISIGQIVGFGIYGYVLAFYGIINFLKKNGKV